MCKKCVCKQKHIQIIDGPDQCIYNLPRRLFSDSNLDGGNKIIYINNIFLLNDLLFFYYVFLKFY